MAAKSEKGHYREITSGDASGNTGYSLFGSDGEYNHFEYYPVWFRWFFKTDVIPILNGLKVDAAFNYSSVYSLTAYNNDTQSAIYSSVLKKDIILNENLNITAVITVKSDKGEYNYLAATKDGFLFSSDYGENWKSGIMKGKAINCALSYKSGKMLFAGTDEGLFASVDYGITWAKLSDSNEISSVRAMFLNDKNLYFASGNGNTYCYVIPETIVMNIYIPVPYLPNDNSTITSKPVFKWSKIDTEGNVEYRLQVSGDSMFNTIITDETVVKTYYQSNLAAQGKYFWRVKVKNIYFESDWSAVNSFTIQ